MRRRALPQPLIARLAQASETDFSDAPAWQRHLEQVAMPSRPDTLDPVRLATEGAVWGSIKAHGLLPDTVIVSDDAGQFEVGEHALCWVHAERLIHQLDTFTDHQRAAQKRMRLLVWWFYRDLKLYRQAPTRRRRTQLRARFDRIFTRRTGFATLDRLLGRLHANKAELLRVLERPEIPLHTNGSENDIRAQVIRRKISGGTRSATGRACRDAFLGLIKTCRKLGVSFWSYLGDRLKVADASTVPPLADLVEGSLLPSLTARPFAPVTILGGEFLSSRRHNQGSRYLLPFGNPGAISSARPTKGHFVQSCSWFGSAPDRPEAGLQVHLFLP